MTGNKSFKIIGVILAVLAGAFLMVAFLWNAFVLGENKRIYELGIVMISQKGTELGEIEIADLEKMETEMLICRPREGKDTEPTTYTCVLFRDVLHQKGWEDTEFTLLIAKSVYGKTKAYTKETFLKSDGLYLAFRQDGLPVAPAGKMGLGPYLLIDKTDDDENWCANLISVELN